MGMSMLSTCCRSADGVSVACPWSQPHGISAISLTKVTFALQRPFAPLPSCPRPLPFCPAAPLCPSVLSVGQVRDDQLARGGMSGEVIGRWKRTKADL